MAYNRPFPVSSSLTAISIAYRNPSMFYIADELLPRVPVGSEKFTYTTYPVRSFFSLPDTLVGRRGRVARVEFTGVPVTDQVNDYGLEDAIPQSDINEAAVMRARQLGNFDPVETATEGLTDLVLVDREIRAAKLAQNPLSYSAANRIVLSGTDQFSDYTNSKPIDIIKACIASVLVFRPNILAMGQQVWDMLSSHPHLVNAIRGNLTSRGIVTVEEVRQLFSLDKVLIGRAVANTSRSGQAPALSQIWGKSISLAYIDPGARAISGMTFGFTAVYGNRIAGSWEDKNIGLEGGQVVRVGEKMKEVVSAPDAGFLIQNAVA